MPSPDGSQPDEGLTRSFAGGPRTDYFNPTAAREAFLDFHQQEYIPVIVFLVKYGARREDAEDAAQEAFIEAWRLTQQPGEWEKIARPRGWIRTVAIRKYQRRYGRSFQPESSYTAETTDTSASFSTIDHGELTAQTEYVRDILRCLDWETRVVMAFHVDGFKPTEIAAQLNMNSQKVRDLTKKGRRALKTGVDALREQDRRHLQ